MALFAGDPAGVQIKKWLVILVLLIVVINVLAAASLIVLQRSVTAIQRRYQPVLLAAGDITTGVYQAQASLYKYLGEYLESTDEVKEQIALLGTTLADMSDLEAAAEWQGKIDEIRGNLAKYIVVVRNLPAIGAGTDWSEVDEFRTQAVVFGSSMEEQATKLKEEVGNRIQQKADQSIRVSRIAVGIFLCFLFLSMAITFLLLLWWRQFQDMILNL